MGLHEEKKTCKIIDELILYLMRKGYKTMNIDITYEENVKTTIVVKTLKLENKIKEKMLKYINQERELEIEEYGWELMGESDVTNELGLVGLLIDSLTINDEGDYSVLTMLRKQ